MNPLWLASLFMATRKPEPVRRVKVRRATVEATVIRADGTRVPLGVVGEYRSGVIWRAVNWLRSFFS